MRKQLEVEIETSPGGTLGPGVRLGGAALLGPEQHVRRRGQLQEAQVQDGVLLHDGPEVAPGLVQGHDAADGLGAHFQGVVGGLHQEGVEVAELARRAARHQALQQREADAATRLVAAQLLQQLCRFFGYQRRLQVQPRQEAATNACLLFVSLHRGIRGQPSAPRP